MAVAAAFVCMAGDALAQEVLELPAAIGADRADATVSQQAFLFRPLSRISLGSAAANDGPLPTDRASTLFERATLVEPSASRGWNTTRYDWQAPVSRHGPLYFEQPALERYGQTYCAALQPVVSAAHFFGCVAALPVKATAARPSSTIYTLGRYRPGSPTPGRLPGGVTVHR